MLEDRNDQALSGWDFYTTAFQSGLLPDPALWVDEWADRHMVIPPELGSAEPGRYRLSRTPFAKDVMRALSPEHPARRVVVKGASQLLKTQVGLNWICAMIAGSPANTIMLQPTDKLAKRVSSRFDKTAAAVKVVAERVAPKRGRDNRNTLDTKEFKGGTLWILTGRSASNLSEASARYVYADEVDRILRELKGEGDPISLLEKRQATFGRKAKGYFTSSPTEEGASRIEEMYQHGNQHRLFVPCPHCEEMQRLEWDSLYADVGQRKAWMVCTENGCIIEEHAKPWMLERHEWRPQSEGDGETWSYEISYLYAPLGWDSWWKMYQEHSDAEEAMRRGDVEKMQVFKNTRLAQTWTNRVSKIEPSRLKELAEDYRRGTAPEPVTVITAAADIQANRIELQIVGWGQGDNGMEPWLLDAFIFYGDPTLGEVWSDLDAVLTTPVQHDSGALLAIRAVCIDSGNGDSTQEVYEFIRKRKSRAVYGQRQTVIAVKGASVYRKPIIAGKPGKVEYNHRGKPVTGGAEVWMIGTDTAKDWIFNRLSLKDKTVIHTSSDFELGIYEQILSEAKITRYESGRMKRRYELIKRGSRNEQLDMLVYNLAAAHHLGVPTYTEQRWIRLRNEFIKIPIQQALATETVPQRSTVRRTSSAIL
jgi:phage terminase large subunit GpA-like protein